MRPGLIAVCKMLVARVAAPQLLPLALQLRYEPGVVQLCAMRAVRKSTNATELLQLLHAALLSASLMNCSAPTQQDNDDFLGCLAALCMLPAASALPAAAVAVLLEEASQLHVSSAAVTVLCSLPAAQALCYEQVKRLIITVQGPAALGAVCSCARALSADQVTEVLIGMYENQQQQKTEAVLGLPGAAAVSSAQLASIAAAAVRNGGHTALQQLLLRLPLAAAAHITPDQAAIVLAAAAAAGDSGSVFLWSRRCQLPGILVQMLL
jgi:hypothetical protein